jgi:hypothetical protein
MRFAVYPGEANSPLVIDSNAVFPGAITLKRFEAISGWNPEIFESLRGVEVKQLTSSNALNCPEPEHRPVFKKVCRVPASKRPNQDSVYYASGIPSIGIDSRCDVKDIRPILPAFRHTIND